MKLADYAKSFFLTAGVVLPFYFGMWSISELADVPELFLLVNILIVFTTAFVYFSTYGSLMFDRLEQIQKQGSSRWKDLLFLALKVLSLLGIAYSAYTLGYSGVTGFTVIIDLFNLEAIVLPVLYVASTLALFWFAYWLKQLHDAHHDNTLRPFLQTSLFNIGKLILPFLLLIDCLAIAPINYCRSRPIHYLVLDIYIGRRQNDEEQEGDVDVGTGEPEDEEEAQPQNGVTAFLLGQITSWTSSVLLAFVVFGLSYFIAGSSFFLAVLSALVIFVVSAVAIRHSVDRLIHKLFDERSSLYIRLRGDKKDWRSYLILCLCLMSSLTFNITFLETEPLIKSVCTHMPMWVATVLFVAAAILFLPCASIIRGHYNHRVRGAYGFSMMLGLVSFLLGLGGLLQADITYLLISILGTIIITSTEGLFFTNFFFTHYLERIDEAAPSDVGTVGREATKASALSAAAPLSVETKQPSVSMVSVTAFTGTFFFFLAALAHFLAPNALADATGHDNNMTQYMSHDDPWIYGTLGILGIMISMVFFTTLKAGVQSFQERVVGCLRVHRSDGDTSGLDRALL